MKGLWRWLALALTAGAMLAGCGSSGGGTAQTATGVFVDAPVQGLNYESGSTKGVTDTSGKFTYEVGKTVKFSIGGKIVLGEAMGKAVLTPVNLVPNAATADASTPEVVKIVKALMTLSTTDPTSGKLTISQTAQDAAKAMAITSIQDLDDSALLTVVKTIDSDKNTLVDSSSAESHMADSIYRENDGAWSGTWTGGGSTGTWQLTINANGTVTGNVPSVGTISGSLSKGTNYSGTAGSSSWTGKMDLTTGTFSGTWSDGSVNGTFTGKKA